jgi:hypothetical protein
MTAGATSEKTGDGVIADIKVTGPAVDAAHDNLHVADGSPVR